MTGRKIGYIEDTVALTVTAMEQNGKLSEVISSLGSLGSLRDVMDYVGDLPVAKGMPSLRTTRGLGAKSQGRSASLLEAGFFLMKVQSFHEALIALTKAIALAPGSRSDQRSADSVLGPAFYARACCLMALGLETEALVDVERCLHCHLEPGDQTDAICFRARVLCDLGEYRRAQSDLVEAIQRLHMEKEMFGSLQIEESLKAAEMLLLRCQEKCGSPIRLPGNTRWARSTLDQIIEEDEEEEEADPDGCVRDVDATSDISKKPENDSSRQSEKTRQDDEGRAEAKQHQGSSPSEVSGSTGDNTNCEKAERDNEHSTGNNPNSKGKAERCLAAGIKIEEGLALVVLSPSEEVLRERSCAAVLAPQWRSLRCHCCFKTCPNLVPCRLCSLALYCSESCLIAAQQSYHGIECPISEALMFGLRQPVVSLAFRRVISLPVVGALDEWEQIQKQRTKLNQKAKTDVHELLENALCVRLLMEYMLLTPILHTKLPEEMTESECVDRLSAYLLWLIMEDVGHCAKITEAGSSTTAIPTGCVTSRETTSPAERRQPASAPLYTIAKRQDSHDVILGYGHFPQVQQLCQTETPNCVVSFEGTTAAVTCTRAIGQGEEVTIGISLQ